jgi:ubiquinone/menaquinone biosynthesis C-methylase UbiE
MVVSPKLLASACVLALLVPGSWSSAGARQLGSRPPDDWIARLESPDRIASLKVDEILAVLHLKPGQVIADIGAGPGLFSLPLARAVGQGGRVYAEEVDQAFLNRINARAKEQALTNVRAVLGKFTDPGLPARDVDLVFFHDVVHHIENRAAFLKTVATYVKPTGRMAIVEYDAKTGPHKDAPALQITRDELDAWMADAGFPRAEPIAGLFGGTDPRWMVIYSRR